MNYCYRFPVVKGQQAGSDYYIGMVPLKMLSKIFSNDDEYVLPEYRAQRRLNENRIPEIKDYILNNRNSYVFSALAASIDGEYSFIPSEHGELGMLEISMEAKFLINDGQHRKSAILAALDECPDIGDETISVVFFEDAGLERSQQMFTDLNKHAVKTSNSLSELYDSRDQLAVITRSVVAKVPFFDEYVDKEKDILGKYSSSLFTLNNIYNANKRMLRRHMCNDEFEAFLVDFWGAVARNMVPWNDMSNRVISKTELREKYIAAQAVILQAFGRVGGCIFDEENRDNLLNNIQRISELDWRRNASIWKMRVIRSNGRMINNERAIILAANVIKQTINIPLSEDEHKAEHEIIGDLL